MAVYFYYGKEEYNITKAIEGLKAKLLDSTFGAMNFRIYYNPTFDELLEVCNSAPLMFGNVVNLIHCENYFMKIKNKKVEFTDTQLKDFEFALKNISDSNNIIFVCIIPRNSESGPDARTKLFKLFAKCSNMKDFPQYREFDADFTKVIQTILKEKELTADTKAINHLKSRLGVNLRLIDSELEKIKTAIYPDKKLTENLIDEYCPMSENSFELANLITNKDKNLVMKYFEAVIEKKHPLEVIGLLQTNLHKLLYIKTYEKEKSSAEMSKELRIPEYPITLLKQRVQAVSLKNLQDLKHNLTETEYKIKSGKVQNAEYALEQVLLGSKF